jgi:hypothetical protein
LERSDKKFSIVSSGEADRALSRLHQALKNIE